MTMCPAAGAGGGYVYRCTLDAGHTGDHLPTAIPVNKPKDGDDNAARNQS